MDIGFCAMMPNCQMLMKAVLKHEITIYTMFTDTVDDKYPQLVPTNNWQEIEPWQSVPHGCKISMNITTGNRYVRLNPIIGSTPAQMDTKNCEIVKL